MHTHITHTHYMPYTHIAHIYMPHTKHTHHTHRSHTRITHIPHTHHISHTPHICTHRSLYSCFLLLPRPESTWLRPFGWNLCWCPGLPCSVVKAETSQIWPLDIPLTGHSLQHSLGESDLPFLTSQLNMWASRHSIFLFMRSAFCCYSSQRCVLNMSKSIILSFFPFWCLIEKLYSLPLTSI